MKWLPWILIPGLIACSSVIIFGDSHEVIVDQDSDQRVGNAIDK